MDKEIFYVERIRRCFTCFSPLRLRRRYARRVFRFAFMLTVKEELVLKVLLNECGEKNGCLLSKDQLLVLLKNKKFTPQNLENILDCLQVDGYFEIIKCVKGGRQMYCVFPKLKARCFAQEKRNFAIGVCIKIAVAVIGSVLAFAVSKILYGLF